MGLGYNGELNLMVNPEVNNRPYYQSFLSKLTDAFREVDHKLAANTHVIVPINLYASNI